MKWLRITLSTVFFIASTWAASAQMVVTPLSSPAFAGGGGGTASEDTPFAERWNPAASAGKQRVTLDGSYFGLVGSQSYGNAVNLGLTLPQRWGVLSTGLSYWDSTATDLNWGREGLLTLSLSKDLWEDFYVGAGIDAEFGSGGWGIGGNFGFQQKLGTVGALKNFRWGAAFRDLGSGYWNNDRTATIPAVFTPALGAEFDVWDDPKLRVTLRPDLSLPSLGDFNATVGSTLAFGDLLSLNIAYGFDLRDTINSTAPQVPISFGIGFHFATDLHGAGSALGLKDQTWQQSEVQVDSSVMPLPGNIYAVGAGANIPLGGKDTQPPVVSVMQKTTFISPNNDGVQDSLSLPIKITDQRYVVGYTFDIVDWNKKTVRTLQSRITLPEAQGLDQIWNRLLYVKHGVDVPPALEWNGTTDAGSIAPDGTYSLFVTAWDDNGNKKTWPVGQVVVKNTPPNVVVRAPLTEFNPVGPRDHLSIVQTGSSEGLWTGTFRDTANHIVLTKTWNDSSPASFDWNGRTNEGKVIPDGVYSYEITATDQAGNAVSAKITNLIVNSIPTPLDLKVNRTAISPAGNGVKTLILLPKAGVTTGMTGWKVQILDKSNTVSKTLTGQGIVPDQVPFNGRDEAGNTLANGEYQAKLTLEYNNGDLPTVLSPVFTVKNDPPAASVHASYTVFSPGSEEGRGVLVFNQTTSEEDKWTGTLKDSKGSVVRTVNWTGKADATYLWDGRGVDGKIQPDGTYTYQLEATDKAGNVGTSKAVNVTIDTAKRQVLLASDRSAFTPISKGSNNKVQFVPSLKVTKGLESWTLVIQDASGAPIKQWSGADSIPASVVWDGTSDSGTITPDGTYTAVIKAAFGNGSTPSARSNPVVLKNSLPTVTVQADTTVFSPTPDSDKKAVTIHQTSSVEKVWTGTILQAGKPIKTFLWKGQAEDAVWDGTDDAGNRVPDGIYQYQVKTTDVADNTASAEIPSLIVDTTPTPLFLTVASDGFSPNGDGIDDTLAIQARVGLNTGIDSWTLHISGDTVGLRKTFTGKGPVPAQFIWDGTTDRGNRTEDGRYSATLDVVYAKGNHPQTQSATFLVQAGPPQLSLDLTPQPFSPDNDGVNDELLVNLGVKSFAPVASWSLAILDPEGHPFIQFSGKGAPSAQLKWDGRSGTGELVQSASDYTATFQVIDTLGNGNQIEKKLSVDVLVIKDGDRLKIIIPSITFAPNSPDFQSPYVAPKDKNDPTALAAAQEKVKKNLAVLKRLAEIFTKYQRYNVGIEGHAVMIHWDDPAKGQAEQKSELLPLSQARADAVKQYLVQLGIAASRITATGIGGARPLVPFSDLDNRWKDRRVEFLLERP